MNKMWFGRTPRKPSGGEQVAHALEVRGLNRASLQARFSNPGFVGEIKKRIGGTEQDVRVYLEFLEANDSPQFATVAKLALQYEPAGHALVLDAVPSIEPVSREEVSRLLPAPSPIREKLLLMLLAEGVKPADLVGIRRDHVNLHKGIIHIRTAKDGKVRDFPVPSKIRPYLEFQTKCLAGPQSFLFSSAKRGKPLTVDDIQQTLATAQTRMQRWRVSYGS